MVGDPYDTTTVANGKTGLSGHIGGAVDPVTGKYYFFAVDNWQAGQGGRAALYEFDDGTNSVRYLGDFYGDWPTSIHSINGDMGFDGQGNLYVVMSHSNRTTQVITITAENLAAASASPATGITPAGSDGSIKIEKPIPTVLDGPGAFKGLAFLSSGKVVISSSRTQGGATEVGESWVWTADPNTWTLESDEITLFDSGSSVTDLGSCSYPPTITVKKDVVGRVNVEDQFTYSVGRVLDSPLLLADATSAGNATGIQNEVAGAALAVVGEEYTVAESGADETDLSKYASTLSCKVDDGDGQELASGATTAGTLTFPEAAAGGNVTCTFTNAPLGEVDWSKVDESKPSKLLSGSKWTLVGPRVSDTDAGETRDVTDCVEDPCAADSLDQDPAAGKFKITNMALGDYVLTETEAPAGYKLDTGVHKFSVEVADDGLIVNVSLDPITNKQAEEPSLPLTGGLSTVMYWLLGGGLLGLSALTGLSLRKKEARTRST